VQKPFNACHGSRFDQSTEGGKTSNQMADRTGQTAGTMKAANASSTGLAGGVLPDRAEKHGPCGPAWLWLFELDSACQAESPAIRGEIAGD